MRNPGTRFSSSDAASVKARFSALAPWLPPNSNSVGRPACLGEILKNSSRTGTPVTSHLRNQRQVSSKCTAATSTRLATTRFANPGTTFGSNTTVGYPPSEAANIAGPDAYPPTPITTSGLNSRNSRRAASTASGSVNKVFTRVASETRLSAPTSMSLS